MKSKLNPQGDLVLRLMLTPLHPDGPRTSKNKRIVPRDGRSALVNFHSLLKCVYAADVEGPVRSDNNLENTVKLQPPHHYSPQRAPKCRETKRRRRSLGCSRAKLRCRASEKACFVFGLFFVFFPKHSGYH